MGFQATDFAVSQVNPTRLALISVGFFFLAAVLRVNKCFLGGISKANVLLRENGSNLDH